GESDRGCFFVVRQRAGPETVRLQLADQLPAEGPVEGRPERVEHAEDIAPLAPLAERMATERTPDAPTPRRGRRRNAREPQHGERDAGDVLGHPVRTVGAEQPASLLRDPGDLEPAVRHAALELADPVLDGPLARERLRPEERERPQVGALRAADLDRFLPGHPPCLSALNDDSPSHPDSSPLPATDPIGAPDPPGPSGGRELAPRWRATPPSGGSFANVEEGRDRGNGWSGRRVAIGEGCRTPCARANTVFRGLSAIDLGTLAVRELLFRAALDPNEVDELVYGTVVHSVTAPNI